MSLMGCGETELGRDIKICKDQWLWEDTLLSPQRLHGLMLSTELPVPVEGQSIKTPACTVCYSTKLKIENLVLTSDKSFIHSDVTCEKYS